MNGGESFGGVAVLRLRRAVELVVTSAHACLGARFAMRSSPTGVAQGVELT
jgi:hypothetical protein